MMNMATIISWVYYYLNKYACVPARAAGLFENKWY